eukprot:scaffold1733_cov391-Prasinococcus_capsulatus_cf.AAC.6
MGQGQSGLPGGPGDDKNKDKDKDKKRYGDQAIESTCTGLSQAQPYLYERAPPTRVGKKQKKKGGQDGPNRLPTITPNTKCKLRLLKLERVKDYLLMEEEFVTNQERLRPQEEKNEEQNTKVEDLRGSPMSVGTLEEIVDDNHAIVSSSVGPEYYVSIMSFVDKDQLEPGKQEDHFPSSVTRSSALFAMSLHGGAFRLFVH